MEVECERLRLEKAQEALLQTKQALTDKQVELLGEQVPAGTVELIDMTYMPVKFLLFLFFLS